MSENKVQAEGLNETTTLKKKYCGKVKNFFTKEAKEGQRVLNWKFWVLAVTMVVVVWVVL